MFIHATIQDLLTQAVEIFNNTSKLTYASIGVGVLLALFLAKIFFDDWQGFWECFKAAERRFYNSSTDERWNALKFWVWTLITIGAGCSAYAELPKLFPQFFH